MAVFLILVRRQLAALLCTPLGYVIAAVFLLVAGLSFGRQLTQSMAERMTLGDVLFGSVFFWIMLVFAANLVAMRLLTEERRAGTLEVLLTAPVSDTQVVLAKFAGALVLIGLMLAPTVGYLVILSLADERPTPDLMPAIAGYAALGLIAAFYLALALWVAALTRHPGAALMAGFSLSCLLLFADHVQFVARGSGVAQVLDYVGALPHIQDFCRGMVDTRPIVLYGAGTLFFLFATIKALEARHWK